MTSHWPTVRLGEVLTHRKEFITIDDLASYKRPRILNCVEKSTHDTRKLETARLLATPIPLPPLPIQRRIVAELDAIQAQVDALKRLQSETAAELDALLPSLLDRAFKGRL